MATGSSRELGKLGAAAFAPAVEHGRGRRGARGGRTVADTHVRLMVFAASTAIWNDLCMAATCARVTRNMRDTSAFMRCSCSRVWCRVACMPADKGEGPAAAGGQAAVAAAVSRLRGAAAASATKALPAHTCHTAR